MIRSGLTNVQKSGYLGYPHERTPNPRNEIERPFVSLGDATILYKSDFSDPQANSTITPSPVLYDDIFAKRTTADERLYVLKQIQQGLSKIQKGLLGKDVNQVPAIPLPDQPGQIIPTPPFGQTRNTIGQPPSGDPPGGGDGGSPGGGDGGPPDLIGASPISSDLIGDSPISSEYFDANVNLAEEELAQDVVANPPVQTSATEEERAANEWLHMQHDPQWAQIEGMTFNTSISSSASARTQLGPDSAGSYNPQRIYPDLTFTPESPVVYPNLTSSASSRNDGHSFDGATSRSPETTEQTQINYLNHLFDDITGLSYERQFEIFSNVDLEARTAIEQLVLTHPNHPITREPVFQNQIDLFSPGMRSAGTPINTTGILTAGTRRTGSPITASASSISSTVSSNGVGPRSRQISRSSGSTMQVDSPPPPRRNPPTPIQTNVGRLRADDVQGVADAYLNPGRRFRGLPRAARTRVLEDAIRQAGLDVTRRPRQRR